MSDHDRRLVSFEKFFEDHYLLVRQYAARRFGTDDADDIAQETMIRALGHFDDIDESRSAQPWLATIARRIGIDSLRRRHTFSVESDVLDELTPSVPDKSSDVALRVDVGGLLDNAMQRLSVREREVLTLHEVYGVDIRDIAANAGTSQNTIRQRLFRARNNLQRHYRELGGSEYSVTPAAPGGSVPRLRRPGEYAVRAAHRLSAHGHQPTGRAAAIATLVAVTATMSSAPPHQPAIRATPPPKPVLAPQVQAPVLPVGLPARLIGGALASVRLPVGPFSHDPGKLPYEEDWETGLDGWTTSGASARQDCASTSTYSGRCSLMLDPDGSVSVSRAFDVPLRSVARATYAVRSAAGNATFVLALGPTTVTVAFDATNRVVTLGTSASVESARLSLVPQDWQRLAVTVNPADQTVEVSQDFYGQALAPAVLRLAARPTRLASVGFGATGHGGAPGRVWFDQLRLTHGMLSCADGVDNDRDGLTDQEDPGCSSLLDDTESPNPECSDGVDNDGDGLVDTADPSCGYSGGSSESPECSDGRDDDGDGHADYPDDPKCLGYADDSERPMCSDGRDNEGDAHTDFPADLGCSSQFDDTEWSCVMGYVDSRGIIPTYVPVVPDKQTRPYLFGVCLDPLDRIAPVTIVAQAPPTMVRGYLNLYRITLASGSYEFPCATLVHDSAEAGPCTAFGARFVRRIAALVREDAEPVSASPANHAFLCTATAFVAARGYENPPERGTHALTIC